MSSYVPPGTYIAELYKPKTVVPPGFGLNLVLVGIGSKEKTITNEVVIRGKIYDELLTVSESSPHTATLANTSDMKKENTVVYKNSNPLPVNAYRFLSSTVVVIEDDYYTLGAIYKIDYVAIDSFVDGLKNAAKAIKIIGLFPGSSNYKELVDFELVSGNIDWSIIDQTVATFTGTKTEPFDTTVRNKLKIGLDGKTPLVITLTQGATRTAAQVASDINTALNDSPIYGADYASVASAVTGKVKLTCPGKDPYAGSNSSIVFYVTAPQSESALNLIFGLDDSDTSVVYQYRGIGKRPLPGKMYYVTYTVERPDGDYNVVRRFNSDIDFYNDIGFPTVGNDLANAGEMAWGMGLLNLLVIQVKDLDDDGVYTDTDFIQAINALVDNRDATDIVVLRSNLVIRAKVKEIVEIESAQLKSNYKRYWCGMPRDTRIGDVETSDTFVFVAKREFEEAPDSVARGRFILVGPSNWSRSFIEDTVEKTIDVDSNFAAVLLAAKTVSFERASDSLFGKTFSGLTLQETWSEAEKQYMASNGIFVLYQEGGVIKVYDSLTTDASGDARYEEPSASVQKDNLAFRIKEAIDSQLRGIVPDDPIEFVGIVKSIVGGIILAEIEAGNVGYYTSDDGSVRDIDYTRDIVVYRLATDPRTYRFRYYFNGRYPAKRFFGEYSVDIPF